MSMENVEQKKLGLRIKSARVLTGLNQQEFAESCGFNHTSLRNWEFGRVLPRRDAINRLIDAFRQFSIYVDDGWIINGQGTGPVVILDEKISDPVNIDWKNELSCFQKNCAALGLNPFVIKLADNSMFPHYLLGDIIGAILNPLHDLQKFPNFNDILKQPLLVKNQEGSYDLRYIFYDGSIWWAKSNMNHHITKIHGDMIGIIVMHISCDAINIIKKNFGLKTQKVLHLPNQC